jgi:hypothetical protein
MTVNINNSFLTNKATDYAILSRLAYAGWSDNGVPSKEYKQIWENMSNKGYQFVAYCSDEATGYSGTIFYNTNTGKYILANRGTEFRYFADQGDIDADTEIAQRKAKGSNLLLTHIGDRHTSNWRRCTE